jgi:hypothetical protein
MLDTNVFQQHRPYMLCGLSASPGESQTGSCTYPNQVSPHAGFLLRVAGGAGTRLANRVCLYLPQRTFLPLRFLPQIPLYTINNKETKEAIMFATSRNLCTEPLNWNRFATRGGEICVPFAHYVQRNTAHVTGAVFSPFLRLPRELQLRVIHFCDKATLFQLMHASSVTRNEAEQLFWSDSNAWYRVSGEWLIAGGFAGHTHYAVDFLHNVHQVEIYFDTVDSFSDDWIDGERKLLYDGEQPSRTADEQIKSIWDLLTTMCPRLTHAVVSEHHNRRIMQEVHKELVQKCPAPISVSASYLQRDFSNKAIVRRHLVKKPSTNNGTTTCWPILDREWTRQTILLPLKTFRGLVGAFQHAEYAQIIWEYQQECLPLLRTEIVEKYYFRTGYRAFRCPKPACPAYFTLPGQWPAHVDECNGHESMAEIPGEFAIQLAEYREEIKRTRQRDYSDAMESIRTQRGVDGSEQQRAVDHAFLEQIEHDPLYACSKPAQETAIWQRYQSIMKKDREYTDG